MIGSQKMSVIKVDQEERLVLMYFLFLIKKIFFQCFFSSEDVEEKIQKLQNECLSFLKHSFTNWIQKDILKVISDWTQHHHEYLGLFFNKFFPFFNSNIF